MLIPSNLSLPPLECCLGTNPSHADNCLPFSLNLQKTCYTNLGRIEEEQWLLVLDRTNWHFGKLKINILVLAIAHRSIAVPILFSMLDNKGGNSSSEDRQNLLTKFISIFGKKRIKGLIADREIIGDNWLMFLAEKSINFYIRIRADITIGRTENELTTANRERSTGQALWSVHEE